MRERRERMGTPRTESMSNAFALRQNLEDPLAVALVEKNTASSWSVPGVPGDTGVYAFT